MSAPAPVPFSFKIWIEPPQLITHYEWRLRRLRDGLPVPPPELTEAALEARIAYWRRKIQ